MRLKYMKYRPVRHILLIAIIFSHLSSLSEAKENIDMGRFFLALSPGKDWNTTIDKKNQTVVFKKIKKRFGSSILVREVDASKIYRSFHSERWVADAYRRGEEADMIVRGVMKGVYELRELKKFELKVDEKDLYVMTYRQILEGLIGHGYLYLYFPDFKESNNFYVFLYFYSYPSGESRDVSLEEVYSVIKGFNLK